jgi:hypothetical protein
MASVPPRVKSHTFRTRRLAWSDDYYLWRVDIINLVTDALMSMHGTQQKYAEVARRAAIRHLNFLEMMVRTYTDNDATVVDTHAPWALTYEVAAIIVLPPAIAFPYARQLLGERFYDMAVLYSVEEEGRNPPWNFDLDMDDLRGSRGLIDLAYDIGFAA